jgi:hypothetical protein
LDEDNLLATPMEPVDIKTLIGKKAQYVDSNEHIWPGTVSGIQDSFIVIKLDKFPSGLGQGQIIEILADSDYD